MKKNLMLIGFVFFALVLVLAACGGDTNNNGNEVEENDNGQANENSNANNATNQEQNESDASGESLELTFSSYMPPQHEQHVDVVEPFFEEIEELTDGRVTGTLYPGEALGDSDAQLDLVLGGVADMAIGVHGYNEGRFPLSSVVDLPLMGETAADVSALFWHLHEAFPEIVEEYEGAKVAWVFNNDPYQFFTADQPIESPEDIEGLRMRTPNSAGSAILEALGAIPVSMPMPDVYEAMQRGVIDGAFVPASVVVNYSMGEVTNYITRGDFMSMSQYTVMNQNTWDQISSDDQAILEEFFGEELTTQAAQAYDDAGEAGWSQAEADGVEIIELTDEEKEEWAAAFETIAEDWVNEMDSNGLPGTEVYEEAMNFIESQ